MKPMCEQPPPTPDDPQVITNHAIQPPQGQASHVAVTHRAYEAVQYDFYIPTLIWELPSVKRFIERLDAIDPGATRFEGLTGVWRGDREGTSVYRKILRRDQFDPDRTRSALQEAVGQLMADLCASPAFAQDTVMFTETPIKVMLSAHREVHPPGR
ncbi:MAG: hypothetical protein WD534_02200 [Phycisphaeraceae bacterium]